MAGPKLLVAGNWKMNGLRANLAEVEALKQGLPAPLDVEVALFPPATLIAGMRRAAEGSAIEIGAQDCHASPRGAFTGDVSAAMLKDSGAVAVILGHSERRSLHGETSAEVRAKAAAALSAGLRLIVCVGETTGERNAGLAERASLRQLKESLPAEATADSVSIAYEPVWAIGSGVTPSGADITAMHAKLRGFLGETPARGARLLYGGSVTPENAAAIFANSEVDGALVGGASLAASSFLRIIAAAQRAAAVKSGKGEADSS